MSPEEVEVAERRRPLDKAWLPWGGAPTRRDLICWYAIWGVFAYAFLTWPLKPWLLGAHPFLMEVLSGTRPLIALAGAFARAGDIPVALAVVGGVIGMLKFSWVFWWAGRLWGARVTALLAGDTGEGRTRSPKRLLARAKLTDGWLVRLLVLTQLPLLPPLLVYAVAGAAGMGFFTFMALSVIGAAIWSALLVWLGHSMGEPAVQLAETINTNALLVSLVLVLGALFFHTWKGRRTRR